MDQSDLTTEYEDCKGQLKSYILRMTANMQDTEDILQDTYIKAQENLEKFREESSLKTWIFAISSNLARDLLRSRKRWPENVTDICREKALKDQEFIGKSIQISQVSDQGTFEIKEHIAFCFTCITKSLPLEQHLCLLLKEIHDFKLKEIAAILELSEDLVKYHLHTARAKMTEIFEGRCSLINKEGICHQCTELNGIFNPKQNAQEELVKIKMVREAQKSDKEHLFNLRTGIVKEIDPFKSGGSDLELHHLEFNRKTMEEYLGKKSE